MANVDQLLTRLPDGHRNGRPDRLEFTCPLCEAKNAYVIINGDELKFNCPSCFRPSAVAAALARLLEDPPALPPPPPRQEVVLREPGADEQEDEFQANLLRWNARVYQVAESMMVQDQTLRKLEGDELFKQLTQSLEMLVTQVPGYAVPEGLDGEHVRGELEGISRLIVPVKKTQLPAKVDPKLAAFEQRAPIDAYAAYEAMRADSRDYSVEGLIRDGCSAVLTGLIGSGKSTMAMNFARAWALGAEVLGRKCRQSKTLVVVSAKEFEAWSENIGFWELKEVIYIVESSKAHFRFTEEAVEWFDYWMNKLGCKTFILDTLFDFFGMPPNNSGDTNRITMNEQNPLLECVRQRNFSGLVTGHAPKSEAKALDPRDPEEAFAGHTAWTAQHRMRMVVRRKSSGVNAFVTGKGGYGDTGVLKEELVLFDEKTRLITLGGLFSEHRGRVAMPSVIEALQALGGGSTKAQLINHTGKGADWILAGLRQAVKEHLVNRHGKGRATGYILASHDDQGGIFGEESH
jgi:hypothetical protein